ncbi:AraC family transcriptional regulator [Prolixibacteraceae bacterium JC049]|nr:AraC family transcriptional regulator [Prolixibacteraceae bacterium JC049]
MADHLKNILKSYSHNIVVDKICHGDYDTNSPHSTTLHRHDCFQIVWLTEGEGSHWVEKKEHTYFRGSIFLLAPYFMHQIEYTDQVQGYVVSFTDIFLTASQFQETLMFYNLANCHIVVPEHEIALFNTEFAHLHYYSGKVTGDQLNTILQNYLHIILTKLSGFRRLQQGIGSNVHDAKLALLMQFVVLVRAHFKEEKNLSFYLDKLAVSQRKLSDVINATTGLPPAKFIEQYTLNEAARLIRYTDESIKEIAAYLGYFDNSYFSKAFKKHFGTTPQQYRIS